MKIILPCVLPRVLAMTCLVGVSASGFAESQSVCANDEQAARVQAYFAENDGLPVTAARRLEMSEIVIASVLPVGEATGTTGEIFHEVWTLLTTLETPVMLFLKLGHVFEMHSKIPPGTPSTRSRYFNIAFEEVEGEEEEGISGHLRPDLVSALYAYVMPGEGGVPVRTLFFYGASGESAFGVIIDVGESDTPSADRLVFNEIWSLIESSPRLCG